jgi:hypothetical protein
MRGHSSIIQMHDYEVGDDYVHMVMECGDQVWSVGYFRAPQ